MQTRTPQPTAARTFLLRMEQFIRRHALFRPGAHLLLGVSGGTDSMAMLDALCQLTPRWRLTLEVAHVNFGLRGNDSLLDERFVRRAAERHGLPFHLKRADTETIARERKQSIQLAAREIRYAFFRDMARDCGAEAVAVAHNAGDNAETMLFNFFRGSGIEGLKGIPVSSRIAPDGSDHDQDHAQTSRIIRPLQFADRSEIEAYMKARRLRHREDGSNAATDYARNFLRRRIIPMVAERINPSLVRTLNNESAIFASCADFLVETVNHSASECITFTPGRCTLSVKYLASLHVFIQQMLVKRSFELLGIEPNFVHIEEITRLLDGRPGRTVDCGGGYRALRTADTIEIGVLRPAKTFLLEANVDETVGTEDFTFSVRQARLPHGLHHNGPGCEIVDASRLSLPLLIRPCKPGDWFMPLGMTARKKLSDFFTDMKIPRNKRPHIPVVLSGEDIVWVAGLRLDERVKVTHGTTKVYQLSIQFHT